MSQERYISRGLRGTFFKPLLLNHCEYPNGPQHLQIMNLVLFHLTSNATEGLPHDIFIQARSGRTAPKSSCGGAQRLLSRQSAASSKYLAADPTNHTSKTILATGFISQRPTSLYSWQLTSPTLEQDLRTINLNQVGTLVAVIALLQFRLIRT